MTNTVEQAKARAAHRDNALAGPFGVREDNPFRNVVFAPPAPYPLYVVRDSEGVQYPIPGENLTDRGALEWFRDNWRPYADAFVYLNNGLWSASDGDNVNSSCYSAQRLHGNAFVLTVNGRLRAFAVDTVLSFNTEFKAPLIHAPVTGNGQRQKFEVAHA